MNPLPRFLSLCASASSVVNFSYLYDSADQRTRRTDSGWCAEGDSPNPAGFADGGRSVARGRGATTGTLAQEGIPEPGRVRSVYGSEQPNFSAGIRRPHRAAVRNPNELLHRLTSAAANPASTLRCGTERVKISSSDPAPGACKYTVQVSGGCYYGWDVNYAAFGWIFSLCNLPKSLMNAEIIAWKTAKIIDWGDRYQALGFAGAGFYGWPESSHPIPAPPPKYSSCAACGKSFTTDLGSEWPHPGWGYVW